MARNWGRFAAIVLALALFAAVLPWSGFGAAAAQDGTAAEGNGASPKEARKKGGAFKTNLAAGELSRIDTEIQTYTEQLSSLAIQADVARQLEPVRTQQLPPLKQQAQGICAETVSAEDKRKFHSQLESLIARLAQINASTQMFAAWETPAVAALCTEIDPVSLLQEIDMGTNFGNVATMRAEAERELEELEERRDQVLLEMTDDLAGASVADNIKWLMLIIFGVGAVTLAGVKIFSDEVQQELIASGQIVQFVTILILLGVILALGLAQRLQAETLGTLLGGLAGYVLSQGVGRQAQRSVLNEIKSAAAVGAPPPGPPPPSPVEPVPGPDAVEPRPA